MEYGIVSLLPTALVLILAVITQRTLESVIAGAIFAFILMDGTGFVDTLAEVSLDVLRDEDQLLLAGPAAAEPGLLVV